MRFLDQVNQQQSHALPSEWQSLRIYLLYRLLLAFVLLALAFFSHQVDQSSFDQKIYFSTSISYLVLCCLSIFTIRQAAGGNLIAQIFIIVFIDILTITLLEYANGESSSNLSILLVVAVAAGSILIKGIHATLFAAIATFAVLYQPIYRSMSRNDFTGSEFIQAGLLGAVFFVTSFLAQQLARSLRDSELLAKRKTQQVAKLEELNHQIIQRMRTGIIVVDANENIRLINETCLKMLGKKNTQTSTLAAMSPQASQQLTQWRTSASQKKQPFQTSPQGPEVILNFTKLEAKADSDVLIFVDDSTRLTQQAQQLKLASLGGLTASIAHEIRNPLGAISHAAQLLMESKQLQSSDARLADIIHQHSLRMNQIIENVLQLSKRKPANPQKLNLITWVKDFLQTFALELPGQTHIDFQHPQADIPFKGDPSQIHQVLNNILMNALRHSEQHTGKKTAQIKTGNLPDGYPFVEVCDQGKGVPEADRDKIFEPFFTTDNAGTGLGLYIAKELCEANQAHLRLMPSATGACFRITFSHPDKHIAL